MFYLLASRDNSIQIWDLRCSTEAKPENVIRNAHSPRGATNAVCSRRGRRSHSTPSSPAAAASRSGVSSSSVTGIKYLQDNMLVSCGDKDGIVKVWDLRRNYSLYHGEPMPKVRFHSPKLTSTQGFTSMAVQCPGEGVTSSVFVNCMDNNIYQFDLINEDEKPLNTFSGCNNSSFYVKIALSPNGSYLVCSYINGLITNDEG